MRKRAVSAVLLVFIVIVMWEIFSPKFFSDPVQPVKQTVEPVFEDSPTKEPRPTHNWEVEKHLNEYANISNFKNPPSNLAPYLKLKILTVDITNLSHPKLHPFRHYFNPEWVARNPIEIGTIILIKTDENFIGNYKRERDGTIFAIYTQNWEMTMIDKSKGMIVAKKTFQCPKPTSKIEVSNIALNLAMGIPPKLIYNDPRQEALNYIKKLPLIN